MSCVTLKGCTPEPLAAYLKSLAVLRLVAEQKDPDAEGWWENDMFHLESTLNEDDLIRFFVAEYTPTPIVAPWGARSGFFPGSSEKSARAALETLTSNTTVRLSTYAKMVTQVRDLLNRHGFSEKPKEELEKLRLMQLCRSELPEIVLPWLDAVYALSNEWRGFAPLLGTGANEGSLGYSSTFAQMLVALGFHQDTLVPSAKGLLLQTLLGEMSGGLVVASGGQHDPGRAGGFNQGPGIEQKDFPINPWSVVLTFEGSLLWSCATTHALGASFSGIRKGFGGQEAFSSPFTVRARAIGYSSSSDGDMKGARAEIWAPLWTQPVGYPELRALLSEGRASVGRKPANDGIEFAEAAASLGVDRGISEFMRYSLLKRRGDSYIALPAGRFPVKERRESDILRDLDPILHRLDRFLRGFKANGQEIPANFASARGRIDDAIYGLLLHGGATRIKALVAAIGRMERLIDQRDRTKPPKLHGPLSGLGPLWLVLADDGSIEVRIAAALASIRATGGVGPIRANLAPVNPAAPWRWGAGHEQVAWSGNSLPTRMVAALKRRMIDGGGLATKPLYGDLPLRSEDIAGFIEGDLDEKLMEDLLFGFTWVSWNARREVQDARFKLMQSWSSPIEGRAIPRSWALMKLLFLPSSLKVSGGKDVQVLPEPSIVPLLSANRIDEACKVAQRRLYSAGFIPIQSRFPESGDGTRIAAALLIPVQKVQSLMRLVVNADEA